jgi:flagellar motor protein MotB
MFRKIKVNEITTQFFTTKTSAEQIAFIDVYETLLSRWFDGKYEPEGKQLLQKSINEMTPSAEALVRKAACLRLMSLAPPPMIGGIAVSNINPFDMLFQNYYGLSPILSIKVMLQQTVGVVKSGKLEELGGIRHKQVSEFNSTHTNVIDEFKNYLPTKKWIAILVFLYSSILFIASNIAPVLELYHIIFPDNKNDDHLQVERQIHPIYFDLGSKVLSQKALERIKLNAQLIQKQEYKQVIIESHTRAVNPNSSQSLSEIRGSIVLRELLRQGIPMEKMAFNDFAGEEAANAPTESYAEKVVLRIIW